MRDFKGKAVVVTGAASGIGKEIARAFAGRGARLAIADIDAGALEAARRELAAAGNQVYAQVADVSRAPEMESFCENAYRALGRVDVLCNNAGVAVGGYLEDVSLRDWEWIVGVNLLGVIHGCHYFYPRMIAQGGGGHVVNIASAAGLFQLPGAIPYVCTKYAVVGFSEALRAEAAAFGIGVSVICPGFVSTGLFSSARQSSGEAGGQAREAERVERRLSRMGRTPRRVARAVLRAVERNQAVTVCFAEAVALDLLHRLSRGVYDRLLVRAVVANRGKELAEGR